MIYSNTTNQATAADDQLQFIVIAVITFIFLAFLLLIMLIIYKSRADKKINGLTQENKQNEERYLSLTNKLTKPEEEVKPLKEISSHVDLQAKSPEASNSKKKDIGAGVESEPENVAWEPSRKQLAKSFGSFFLGMPHKNGTFEDKISHTFNPTVHMYQLTRLNEQGTKGNFTFFWNDSLEDDANYILQNHAFYIDPVCTHDGIPSRCNRIVTVKEGRVVRDKNSNYWKVTKKAVIKFE